MLQPLIDAIQGAVNIQKIETPDGTFYSQHLIPAPDVPAIDSLVGYTLTGLIDFIQNLQSSPDQAIDLIQIVNPTTVKVLGPYFGRNNQRNQYYKASFPLPDLELFDQDRSYYVSELIQRLQIQFYETKDRDDLIAFLSVVSVSDTREEKDNGVCSEVIVKQGVQLSTASVPKTITLAPYRSFVEVGQLPSTFNLRIKKTSSEITCTLKTNDGGKWQTEAMKGIKSYLATALQNTDLSIPIIC